MLDIRILFSNSISIKFPWMWKMKIKQYHPPREKENWFDMGYGTDEGGGVNFTNFIIKHKLIYKSLSPNSFYTI
jgi:hypothetical protein